jgi:hypothetical protein
MRDLVGFESWAERYRVMVLDFSPEVVAFSLQPLSSVKFALCQ